MVTIALDAMGSDHGVDATVGGAAELSFDKHCPQLILVGNESEIRRALGETRHDPARIDVVHAAEVVGMDDSPKRALQEKKDASIVVATQLVKDRGADALVSAGNTGAVTLACSRSFRRLDGVARCALGAVYPTERRRGEKDDPFSLILDAGLTLDVSG
ncbi:MAG: phosphate acyltransferase PlsX, partial [Myxococcota bacterium]